MTEEDRSDEGDGEAEAEDLSGNDNDESGTETTEAEEGQTIESSADSTRAASPAPPPAPIVTAPAPVTYQEQLTPPPQSRDGVPVQHKSHASNVAASRGLNINVVGMDRPRSRVFMGGLPASPRPGYSPMSTPTSGPKGEQSPHTPR